MIFKHISHDVLKVMLLPNMLYETGYTHKCGPFSCELVIVFEEVV